MKNQIRMYKTQFKKYVEKTEEILKELNNDKNQKELTNTFNEVSTKVTKIDESENENLIDFLNENLNKIRFLVKEKLNFHQKCKFDRKNMEQNTKNNKISKITKNKNKTPSPSYTNFVSKIKPEKISINIRNFLTQEDLNNGISRIIDKVPRLIPEEFVQKCGGCDKTFGVCRWKYHCRVCGYLFCHYCSWNFDNFVPFYLNIVRICDFCYEQKKNKCYLYLTNEN